VTSQRIPEVTRRLLDNRKVGATLEVHLLLLFSDSQGELDIVLVGVILDPYNPTILNDILSDHCKTHRLGRRSHVLRLTILVSVRHLADQTIVLSITLQLIAT